MRQDDGVANDEPDNCTEYVEPRMCLLMLRIAVSFSPAPNEYDDAVKYAAVGEDGSMLKTGLTKSGWSLL
jgi:hypothetical protein